MNTALKRRRRTSGRSFIEANEYPQYVAGIDESRNRREVDVEDEWYKDIQQK